MKTRIGTLAVLTAVLACAPAYAAPVSVKLRVEGATKTIFEGKIATDVHQVTGDQSGPHKCDGTNGGTNTTPGPTATGALDDAADSFNFSWAGSYSSSFDDFTVDQIGPDSSNDTQFWGLVVNGQDSQVGGCQYKVAAGDEVVWAYDLFSKKNVLLLRGPTRARAGRPFTVRVKDGRTGQPVAGARVGGRKTGANGVAKLRYTRRGVRRLKARRADSVRSNMLRVKVLPPRG